MSPEEAASYIRIAFGYASWRKRERKAMDASMLATALCVGQQMCGSKRLGRIVKWAFEMRRADDLYRD